MIIVVLVSRRQVYVIAKNTVSQPEGSSDDVVDTRKLLALVISAGGVQAMTAVVGILTIKIVAPLGSQTLAAVTGGQRLYFIIQAILLGLNVGTMAMVSQSIGQERPTQAYEWLRASLLLALLVCVPLSVIFWFAGEPLLSVLGLSGNALSEGGEYVRQLTFYIWGIGIYLLLASALRAMNLTTIPLVCGVLLNLLTIYLTYAFVQQAVNQNEVAAGAVSTAAGLGNLLGLLLMLALLWRKLTTLFVGLWPLDKIRTIWRISYPAVLEQLIRQGSVLAYLWVVAHFGDAAYAAYGAGIMLMAVSFVIGFGFSIATAVMVGQALGKNNVLLATRVVRKSMSIAVGLMSVLGVFLGFFANELALWLVLEGDVVEYTATFILVFALIQPVMAADYVYVGALQGSGDTRWPMVSVIIGPLVVRFCVAFVLLWVGADVTWIFATILIDYLVKAAIVGWRTKTRFIGLRKKAA